MYSAANVVQPVRSGGAAKTTLPVIATICCGALLLLLLAATIVLALIPIYLPKRSVTRNLAASLSAPITMKLNTGIPIASGRKRQSNSASSSLSDCIGCTFDGAASQSMAGQLLNILQPDGTVQNVSDVSVTVSSGLANKKRYTLKKRQITIVIILIVEMRLFFRDSCAVSCQHKKGSDLKSRLNDDIGPSTLSFANVVLLDTGGKPAFTITTIIIIKIVSISDIGPSVDIGGGGTQTTQVTVVTTPATTAAATTVAATTVAATTVAATTAAATTAAATPNPG